MSTSSWRVRLGVDHAKLRPAVSDLWPFYIKGGAPRNNEGLVRHHYYLLYYPRLNTPRNTSVFLVGADVTE